MDSAGLYLCIHDVAVGLTPSRLIFAGNYVPEWRIEIDVQCKASNSIYYFGSNALGYWFPDNNWCPGSVRHLSL